MERKIHVHARLVGRNHQRVALPECALTVGEIRVDPQNRDVEVVDIDNNGIATFLPLRGDRTLFKAPCMNAMDWQYLGMVEDHLVA